MEVVVLLVAEVSTTPVAVVIALLLYIVVLLLVTIEHSAFELLILLFHPCEIILNDDIATLLELAAMHRVRIVNIEGILLID